LNAARGLFPAEAFARRVERAWSELFHYLPQYGARVALAHLKLSGRYPWDRLSYLMKVRVRSFLNTGRR
jgi:hypothetical protein